MKIICQEKHRKYVENVIKDYQYLDVVLVERGLSFHGVAYIFEVHQLDKVIEYLEEIVSSSCIIYAKKNNRYYKVDAHLVVYIEGFSKEAYIHTIDTQFEIKEKLYELEEKLRKYGFIRISKSIIINCRMIVSFEPLLNMKYRVYLKNNVSVEISRTYLKKFREFLEKRF